MTCERISYRAPAGEHSGIKTLVTDTSKKNLPPNTSKSPEQNYRDRPGTPEHKEQALPITPKHEERRDKQFIQKNIGQPGYNGPSESGKGPDEQSVHKDKVRTKSQPGEEYGHPYMDQGPAGIKKRRTDGPTASMRGAPYPGSHRQKKRLGPLKRYTQRYYKKNKSRIKMRMRRWYNVHSRNKRYRLDKKRRRQHPERFRRLPGGGARTFAEQAKKRKKKGAPAFWFYHPASDREGMLLQVTDEGVVLYAFEGVHGVTLLDAFLDQVVFDEADMDRAWAYLDTVFDCSDLDEDCDWDSDMASIERVAARHGCHVQADFMYEKAETDRENTDSAYDRGQGWTKRKQKQEEESPILEHPYSHSVPNNPGSAKVIPEGHDFRNKDNRVLTRAASLTRRYMRKQAAYISEIESRTAQEIHRKARGLSPKLRRVDAKLGMWTWEVPGSGNKPYTVKVKATRKGNVLDVGKLDVYVACSCPFWQWQGPEYHAKQGKYLLGKTRGTATAPAEKDPQGKHAACKHVLSVFAKIKAMGSVRKEWGQRQGSLDFRYLADRIAQGDVRVLSVQRVASRYREKYLLDSEG